MIKIIECPRDAMQGITTEIPTSLKVDYINTLLKAGFDTIDFGSFVSPKAVPQMADTAEVLAGLDLNGSRSKLLAIIANVRGAEDACQFPQITYLGYPFSISETFQQRNTRKSMEESLTIVERINSICNQHEKELVVYISMAFGNPYGDPWSPEIVLRNVDQIVEMGIGIISLADTVGSAQPEVISDLFNLLLKKYPEIEIGAHFHSHPDTREEKLKAAWEAGCRRFDVALNGFGGCPFAKDELVGNIATESILDFCKNEGIATEIDQSALLKAGQMAPLVFG